MAVLNYHYAGHPEDAINIMRPSRYANPYIIGRDGTRDWVISRYRGWLWSQIQSGAVTLEELAALHGRDLVCCCKPADCHGDVLEGAAEWAYKELERRAYRQKALNKLKSRTAHKEWPHWVFWCARSSHA